MAVRQVFLHISNCRKISQYFNFVFVCRQEHCMILTLSRAQARCPSEWGTCSPSPGPTWARDGGRAGHPPGTADSSPRRTSRRSRRRTAAPPRRVWRPRPCRRTTVRAGGQCPPAAETRSTPAPPSTACPMTGTIRGAATPHSSNNLLRHNSSSNNKTGTPM